MTQRLHASWIRRLRWHFDLFNEQYLSRQLRPPLFQISTSGHKLGEWRHANRTIAISENHVLRHNWETVMDTLRHEMAHQYVDELLGMNHAPPHGEPFVRACRLLRCDAGATADPGKLEFLEGSAAGEDKILIRIKELLALAKSPNEHEAANAMRMAQKYLLKYNLDLAQVDRELRYAAIFLGRCRVRIQEYLYTLSNILQDHFFVLPIWTFSYDPERDLSGRILQISGTVENLQMAEYVYNYVTHTANALWNERRKSPRSNSQRGGRGTKLQYLAGLLRGFQEKLQSQKQELKTEQGLVWLGDPDLKNYFCHLHPRTRMVSTSGVERNSQYHAGVRDGKEITIRRGLQGKTQKRGRLITGPES